MSKVVPVILAGGAGTRLWPVSRDALPKQFLPLVGERSTYQDTLLRVADDTLFARPIVITGSGASPKATRRKSPSSRPTSGSRTP